MTRPGPAQFDPRTLPLRVPLADGEALDSWLLRLAYRNEVPLRRLAHRLGLGDRLRIWRNYALTKNLPHQLMRRIETQTGLAPGRLDAAVLDQFDVLGWTPIRGSRYCPQCLTENGGWWPLRWQLPHSFACPTHRCLLAVVCPSCGRMPHSRISQRSGLEGPTACALGATRHARACAADLLATARPAPLPGRDPRLVAQAWIDQRLDRMDPAAVTDLRDLDAITRWLPWRVASTDLEYLGSATVTAIAAYRENNNALRQHNPAAALVAAAMACHAIDIISPETVCALAGVPGSQGVSDHERRRTRLAPFTRGIDSFFHDRNEPETSTGAVRILSARRLTSVSSVLQRTVLHGIDKDLSATERLRYRTRTPMPRPPAPGPDAADRARRVPQYLWPDWLVRFHPPDPTRAADVAVTLAAALLIPGNPTRNSGATDELTRWRTDMGNTLSRLARSHPDVLTAICELADYVDRHAPPIDYRRRRTVFPTIDLTEDQWRAICTAAGHVRLGTGTKALHARRHLFVLLTGANLADPRHSLAPATPQERSRHQGLELRMPAALRAALHDHAAELLSAAGIDEPVTWSPPSGLAAGLELPGHEPDDIDTTALRKLVLDERARPGTAARILQVSTHHVRYTITQLDLPMPTPPPRDAHRDPHRRTEVRARAEQLLTAEFFAREHTRGGKNIITIAAETSVSPGMVRDYAKRAGIQLLTRPLGDRIANPEAVRDGHIDHDWLREQVGTLRRTNTDVAEELGISPETIRKLRRKLGISPIRQGAYNDRRYPDLPVEIRRAVESRRGGWQRLRRFEETSTHHSINLAAAVLGHHTSNLNLQIQRLETDMGGPLLVRGTNRYHPIAPTALGRRVLNQLRQPEVRALLDEHAAPGAHQHRDSSRRTHQPTR
ncbi:TniQ family protein [Promicromonospora sp. NPDC023987]|uniref:TniQ family protein n=1 Tax=Promicromonospora sp. NPDC023987 TaxID=3155360 RepID=UPI0033F32523